MYNKPGRHPFTGGAGFEVNHDDRGLLKVALFMRRNAAPHLGSPSVGDVEKVLTDFISDNFWIIGNEAWDGCLLGAGQARDAPFSEFLSADMKEHLAETIAVSDLFVEPRQLVAFPLVTVHVEEEFECPTFLLVRPDGPKIGRLPPGYIDADLQSDSFPPFGRWDGIRRSPMSWLGVWADTAEVEKRHRAAILGAVALLPHRLERYLFSGRKLFGGLCTFAGSLSMTSGNPHTPPQRSPRISSSVMQITGGWQSWPISSSRRQY